MGTELLAEVRGPHRDPQACVDLDSYYKLQDVMIKIGFQRNRIDPKLFVAPPLST